MIFCFMVLVKDTRNRVSFFFCADSNDLLVVNVVETLEGDFHSGEVSVGVARNEGGGEGGSFP